MDSLTADLWVRGHFKVTPLNQKARDKVADSKSIGFHSCKLYF